MNTIGRHRNAAHVIRNIAGILCLSAILFISIFALDAFDPSLTILQQTGAFLIHLLPSFVLLAMLLLAWKKAFIGGSIFLLTGLLLSPFIYTHNYSMNQSVGMSLGIVAMINLPFILVGMLFLVSAYLQQEGHQQP